MAGDVGGCDRDEADYGPEDPENHRDEFEDPDPGEDDDTRGDEQFHGRHED